jgi:hypothetical protein
VNPQSVSDGAAHEPHPQRPSTHAPARTTALRAWLALVTALVVLVAAMSDADAERRQRRGRRAKPAASKRARRRPPAPAPAPAATPDDNAPDAAPARTGASSNGKDTKGKTQVFDFTGLELGGRMRTPQLLYFLDRAEEELDRAALEKRSFVPEMTRSLEEEPL